MTVLSQLFVEIPLLVVWIGGLVWAIRTWSRHPRVSLLVVVGLAIQIVDTLGASALNGTMPFLMEHYGSSIQEMGVFYTVIGIGRSLASTAAWALILVAMFGWRPIPAPS